MENFYTDMAVEAFERGYPEGIGKTELKQGIVKSVVHVDTEAKSREIGKKKGVYVTFDAKNTFFRTKECEDALVGYMASALRELSSYRVGGRSKVLAVGLGNGGMTADSLGPKTLSKLKIEPDVGKRGLLSLIPGVQGVTGIESFDIIKGVVDKIKPDLVLAVDTLASSRSFRLYSSFQFSTAGISPGGGVGNEKRALCYESLSVPVIAVGVPLVLYARTLVADSIARYSQRTKTAFDVSELNVAVAESLFGDYNLVVTPKEIDLVVDNCADVLARAVNKAFAR